MRRDSKPATTRAVSSRPFSFRCPATVRTESPVRIHHYRRKTSLFSVGVCSRTICWPLSSGALCCWLPPSEPSPFRHAERRDFDEPGGGARELPGRGSHSFRAGSDWLSGPAQSHHHVFVGGNDAPGSGPESGRLRPPPGQSSGTGVYAIHHYGGGLRGRHCFGPHSDPLPHPPSAQCHLVPRFAHSRPAPA